MKISVSVPVEDLAFIDRYARERQIGSRSAVIQRALGLLRASHLSSDYAAAWAEWEESTDAEDWDGALADGLDEARRDPPR